MQYERRALPAVRTYTDSTMRRHLLLLSLLLLTASLSAAAQRTLTLSEVDEAIRLGQTRIAADRARFHAPYRFIVGQFPVDYVDVITPYRRVVIAAEQSAQIGDRSFGQRQALQLLTEADGQFDLVIEFTFHPLNTYIGMPLYDVIVVRGPTRLIPASLDRQPRFGARVEGLPPPLPVPGGQIPGGRAQPILGGTITARFKGEDIALNGSIELIVSEQGKDLARVTMNVGRLR